jgi:hypothetical protein
MIEQGPARHPHQGLRHLVRQGTHAHAETGGKDHGFAGFDRHFWGIHKPLFLEALGGGDHITAIGAPHRSPMP